MSRTKTKKYSKHKTPQLSRPMIALVVCGVLLIIGTTFALKRSSKPKDSIQTNGAPRLKVDQEIIDLGDKKLGQMAEVTFHLTNIGDQPLSFSKTPYVEVKEGC